MERKIDLLFKKIIELSEKEQHILLERLKKHLKVEEQKNIYKFKDDGNMIIK